MGELDRSDITFSLLEQGHLQLYLEPLMVRLTSLVDIGSGFERIFRPPQFFLGDDFLEVYFDRTHLYRIGHDARLQERVGELVDESDLVRELTYCGDCNVNDRTRLRLELELSVSGNDTAS